MLPPLLAYNTRGSSQGRTMDDDDCRKERRRIMLLYVIWAIWAAVWALIYFRLMAP